MGGYTQDRAVEYLHRISEESKKTRKVLEDISKSLNSLARSAEKMKRAYCYEPITTGWSEEEIKAAFYEPIVDVSSIKKGEENHEQE